MIPVRDEAARLPATLRALAVQVDGRGAAVDPGRFEVIVLANNCSDGSADAVRRFAARHPHLHVHVAEARFDMAQANVGHARACLMDEACRRLLALGRSDGVIASTDGDTQVARDWLAATIAEMRRGADAVGGRIHMDDDIPAAHGLSRLARRDATYQRLRARLEHVLDPNPADPWPRHHQHFGASLAIQVHAYLRVGGLPATPYLEDEALVQALLAHDLTVRHSERVKVVTSNRRRGRVAVGLSWQLREWAALAVADADATVGCPAALAQELILRRRLRECWVARPFLPDGPAHAARIAAIAAGLGVPAPWLSARLRSSNRFGALWHAIGARRQARKDAGAGMPMRQAIALLRDLLAVPGVAAAPAAASRAPAASAAVRVPSTAGRAVSAARRGQGDSVLAASPSRP